MENKYETLTLGQALDAVAKGEEVEYTANPIGDDVWENLLARTPFAATESRDWQFRRRIPAKPPQYRPWVSPKEVPFGKMVKRKVPISGLMLNSWGFYSGELSVNGVSAKMLFEDYVMDDGSPCGVEVQE